MEYSNKQDKSRKQGISTEAGEIRQNDRQMLYKVPVVITIFFWIIKIMATTVGETGADYMIEKLNLGLTNTTIVMSILLIIILLIQFKARVYVPSIYWLTVVLISVVGTLVTDNLTDNLGVPLQLTTIFFTVALLVTFVAWYASEKTLSIHSIYTIKREAFYWLSILFTFALGTAAGDLIAEGLDLGYLTSALIFAALIGLVTIAYYVFKLNAVLAFWIAYILTRPFGASLGDYLSQSQHAGGLGLGTFGTSVIFLLIIIILVFYLTKTRRDAPSLTESLGKS
ncbi:hypothetical protein ACFVP8_12215 [Viridibacillus arvi]|uniref:COG4705 family protein n=1 Tax=Viridibacillus arvi TaxID=263475 RepID=UPI003686504A